MTMMASIIPTTAIAALGTETSLPCVWLACMLCICALNGAAALACVAVVLTKTNDHVTFPTKDSSDQTSFTPTSCATPHMARRATAVLKAEVPRTIDGVCGKRKTRDHQPEFPFARKRPTEVPDEAPITQGRTKLRRVTKINIVRFGARRSRSFGSELLTSAPPSPLRRVASCGDSSTTHPFEFNPIQKTTFQPMPPTAMVCAPLEEAVVTVTDLLREIRLPDVLSSAKTVVVAKLREAARNAVDEVLTSIISFLTYGMLLFILRQYSAVAVGVSLDLGAFSIEL